MAKNDPEIENDLKKVIDYMHQKNIPATKKAKQRLAKKFPSLKDEIMNLDEEVKQDFTGDVIARKKD